MLFFVSFFFNKGLNSSSDTIASESQNSDLNQVSSREGEIMSEKELQDQISVDERGKDSDIQDTDITDYKQSLALNTKVCSFLFYISQT